MPLGRKHLRRSRDAPTGGIGHTQRATSRLGVAWVEVKRIGTPNLGVTNPRCAGQNGKELGVMHGAVK
jgi:hypothetical protein